MSQVQTFIPNPSANPLSSNVAMKESSQSFSLTEAAAAIGVSIGVLNCYTSIYRSLGGKVNIVEGRGYLPSLVQGFQDVCKQVRAGADIRKAMYSLVLKERNAQERKLMMRHSANGKKKKGKRKQQEQLEHLFSINTALSEEVSQLRAKLLVLQN